MRARAARTTGSVRFRIRGTAWLLTAMAWTPPPIHFDPAGPVRAGGVRAGLIGAAFAHLAGGVDGDLPGLLGHQPQRGLLLPAQ
jgi:hypothetical protein